MINLIPAAHWQFHSRLAWVANNIALQKHAVFHRQFPVGHIGKFRIMRNDNKGLTELFAKSVK